MERMVKVYVKHGKQKHEYDLNLDGTMEQFRAGLYSLTHVPIQNQKILFKGKTLKDDCFLSSLAIKDKSIFMLMGAAVEKCIDNMKIEEEIPEFTTKYLEDIPPERREFYSKAENIRCTKQYQPSGITVKEFACLGYMNFPHRQEQQDAYFNCDDLYKDGQSGLFGVLDGHSGCKVAQYANENFPKEFKFIDENGTLGVPPNKVFEDLFKKINNQIHEKYKEKRQIKNGGIQNLIKGQLLMFQHIKECYGELDSSDDDDDIQFRGGACVCLVLIRQFGSKKKCYVANIGDTRAVLCQNGQARRVSTDHKASAESEQRRIKEFGGNIFKPMEGQILRLGGQLAITRSLGDFYLEKEGLSVVPDIQEFEIDDKTQFLIIASDGLWDVCEDQEAVDLVLKEHNSKKMCEKLVKHALDKESHDNTTVMVLRF